MIRPEQLVEALDRMPPRDRELLSLSLRRRVPDEALGRLYECSPSEVARLRARAIERLADEMELQRGEDLGAVLKALLEPGTWTQAAGRSARSSPPAAAARAWPPCPRPRRSPRPSRRPALVPVPPPPDARAAPEADAGARARAGAARAAPGRRARSATRARRWSPSASARPPIRRGARCRWRWSASASRR